jgi:hypothetical protein
MKEMGISETQIDEIKSIFTETNLYLILLTFLVSLLHVRVYTNVFIIFSFISLIKLLFEFLAFKNDISFWRERKTNVGLSVKTCKMFFWFKLKFLNLFLFP